MDHSLHVEYVAFVGPHVTCGFLEGSVKNSIYATEINVFGHRDKIISLRKKN